MAFTFALNISHDLTITSAGHLALTSGAEEVKQRVIVALLHGYGEYFLNVPSGMPWKQYILGNKNRTNVELLVRRNILAVPGVVGIVNLELLFASRTLDIYADVEVSGGEVVSINVGG